MKENLNDNSPEVKNEQTEKTPGQNGPCPEECDKKKSSLKEALARTAADFENFRKRSEKERLDFVTFSRVEAIGKMIPFLDEVDLAIKASESLETTDQKTKDWIKGLCLIKTNMEKTFEKMGVEKIDCAGNFDPEKHEAVAQVDQASVTSGDIVDVFRKGYKLGGKIIRHAQVSVAK
jgi:molecular chaperone GrpE